jgi:hypothetical protein
MMVLRLVPLLLFAHLILFPSRCLCQELSFELSIAKAVERAQREGKLVLGEFGRSNCLECVQTKAIWESPAVRGWIQATMVPWELDVDQTNEWQKYTAPLTSFTLPFIAWIDPGQPETRFHYRTGIVGPTSITQHLTNQAMNYLPLMVLNLPGAALETNAFTVEGLAKTNALVSGAVVNVAISNVFWRLENSANPAGEFQNVTSLSTVTDETMIWSQTVNLRSGSNVFASYVQYVDGRTSWTNRVPLVYDGPSVGPFAPASLVAATLDGDGFSFQVRGEVGQVVIVERASVFNSWLPLATNVLSEGGWRFTDSALVQGSSAFYRVVTPP